MNMKAYAQVNSSGGATLQRGRAKCKGGMQTITGGNSTLLRLLTALRTQRTDETFIFTNARLNNCRTIAI